MLFELFRSLWGTKMMYQKWYLAILIALLPLVAQGGWVDPNGKLIPDTESMRSVDDFGV